MRKRIKGFFFNNVETPVAVEEPVIVEVPEKEYDMSLKNWNVTWIGWNVCPKCVTPDWPVKTKMHPIGGGICYKCDSVAPMDAITIILPGDRFINVIDKNIEYAAETYATEKKYEGPLVVQSFLYRIEYEVIFIEGKYQVLEQSRKPVDLADQP